MSKSIIYPRKSTKSEDHWVLSIDSQIKQLKEGTKKIDLDDSTVMRESGRRRMNYLDY